MYTVQNFKTKKAMKDALVVSLEGPHYPEPHHGYARVQLKDGITVKVLS